MKRGARCVRCSRTSVNACPAKSRHTVHFEFRSSSWAAIGSKLHLSWSLEPGCVPSEPVHCISDIDMSLAPTLLSDNSPCVCQAPCVSMTLHLCLLRVRKQSLTVKCVSKPDLEGEQTLWTTDRRTEVQECFLRVQASDGCCLARRANAGRQTMLPWCSFLGFTQHRQPYRA